MKKKIIASIMIALMGFLPLGAQSLGFLNLHPDAGAAGMAGVSVAMKAGAYAPENNLAAAALQDSRLDVAAGYTLWMPKVSKTGLLSASGYYKVTDRLAVGIDGKSFSSPTYTITTTDGRAKGTFTPKEMAFGAGASFRIFDGFAAGLHLKLATSSLAEEAKATAFGADLSLKYEKDALQAGLAVDNLGGKVKYGEDSSYPMPMCIRAGAAYSIAGLTASAEGAFLSGGMMAGAGVEYAIRDMVFLRGGYHYGGAIPSYASLGAGVKVAGVHLDFAYLLASETVGGSLMATLGYRF